MSVVKSIGDLVVRVAAGRSEYAVLLAGGLAMSRKTIRIRKGRGEAITWLIRNHIDDTSQKLTVDELWTESNIGEALDKGALVEIT